jgi:hypothetical protein
LADDGGHDVDDAPTLLKAMLRYTPPSPDLLVSGENPKLRLGRRQCSGIVPSVEALSGDTGLVVEVW